MSHPIIDAITMECVPRYTPRTQDNVSELIADGISMVADYIASDLYEGYHNAQGKAVTMDSVRGHYSNVSTNWTGHAIDLNNGVAVLYNELQDTVSTHMLDIIAQRIAYAAIVNGDQA